MAGYVHLRKEHVFVILLSYHWPPGYKEGAAPLLIQRIIAMSTSTVGTSEFHLRSQSKADAEDQIVLRSIDSFLSLDIIPYYSVP